MNRPPWALSRWLATGGTETTSTPLRRDGALQPRQRRRMAPEGLDPHYSDSYVPTEIDLLAYGTGDHPQWTTLGRIG